jgi:hypothetical protein
MSGALSTGLVVILAAIGVYFAAFLSLPTTVSWAPSVSALVSGDDLTVSGQITPANGGRQVLVQNAPTASGPWVRMSPTVTTNGGGRFAITFKPHFTGTIVMRVVVDPAGRYLDVIGLSKPVRLLTLSSISLKGGGLLTNEIPVSFTVAVDPPRSERLQVVGTGETPPGLKGSLHTRICDLRDATLAGQEVGGTTRVRSACDTT